MLKNKKFIKLLFPICCALLFLYKAEAQEVLTLQSAIKEALEHNYGIRVAEKQVEAAENQIYRGNARMAPTLSWNSTLGGNLNQVNQVFLDGRKLNRLGYTASPNTSLQLTWTLYDGQRMQVLYDKLKVQGQQSLLQKKLEVQSTVANLMQAYFEILRQKKAMEYLETIISYYEERLKITEERWQIGRGSKLDYLQSKTDLTMRQIDLVNAVNNLKTGKVLLNNILGAPADRNFHADDKLNESNRYELEQILTDAKLYNRELLVMNKEIELSLLKEREAKSYLKPRISLNSGFGYSFNKSNAGFLSLNQNFGLNAGLTASWTIFNGHKTQRDIELAKINTEIAETQKQGLLNQIEAEITSAYYQYESDREMFGLELANKTVAEENLTISLEKFKLGASTILELNDAQQRFDLSLNRLVNAEFNKRISELELLRLSGTLLE